MWSKQTHERDLLAKILQKTELQATSPRSRDRKSRGLVPDQPSRACRADNRNPVRSLSRE
jgi:hypothetical protein